MGQVVFILEVNLMRNDLYLLLLHLGELIPHDLFVLPTVNLAQKLSSVFVAVVNLRNSE
jgi:hypothetical protein